MSSVKRFSVVTSSSENVSEHTASINQQQQPKDDTNIIQELRKELKEKEAHILFQNKEIERLMLENKALYEKIDALHESEEVNRRQVEQQQVITTTQQKQELLPSDLKTDDSTSSSHVLDNTQEEVYLDMIASLNERVKELEVVQDTAKKAQAMAGEIIYEYEYKKKELEENQERFEKEKVRVVSSIQSMISSSEKELEQIRQLREEETKQVWDILSLSDPIEQFIHTIDDDLLRVSQYTSRDLSQEEGSDTWLKYGPRRNVELESKAVLLGRTCKLATDLAICRNEMKRLNHLLDILSDTSNRRTIVYNVSNLKSI